MATYLCGVTKNINIGCGFNIVPMWHPLRLAEDYAMTDILTGGRVIFGGEVGDQDWAVLLSGQSAALTRDTNAAELATSLAEETGRRLRAFA